MRRHSGMSSSCWSAICMMVAGHRLMDGQRRQFPQRPLVELRGVDVIDCRRSPFSGCPAGNKRWSSRRDFGGISFESRRAAAASFMNRLGILPSIILACSAVGCHQLLGRLGVIFGVGPHVGDHRLAAGEAGLLRHLAHLGPDPRDFAQGRAGGSRRGSAWWWSAGAPGTHNKPRHSAAPRSTRFGCTGP